jgi:DNA-binding GntR family transcriptional regulator
MGSQAAFLTRHLMKAKRLRRNENSAGRAYEQLRQWAIEYKLRPGERLNEVELAAKLKISRTPLRAALNRLVAEGFLHSVFNRGFYGRPLEVKAIFDLYELRCEVEIASIRFACARVSDAQLDAFEEFVRTSATKYDGMTLAETVRTDEAFHVKLAELSGNVEMLDLIRSINARIRFVRGIDIMRRIPVFVDEHAGIMAALRARDAARCDALMRGHIERRLDQIVDVVKEGVVNIYVAPQLGEKPAVATRRLRKTA